MAEPDSWTTVAVQLGLAVIVGLGLVALAVYLFFQFGGMSVGVGPG